MNTSSPHITQLAPDEVFVFGSNLAGIAGAGAAAYAHKHFGAQMGVGSGPTGRCYAIPTKSDEIQTLPLGAILPYVQEFVRYTYTQPKQRFLVTALGTGLAGIPTQEIAPMFFHSPNGWVKIPDNIFLPETFWSAMQEFPDFDLYKDGRTGTDLEEDEEAGDKFAS